ncbi:type II CRISPR RNA-guided endonuclease Cas9 [Aquimarina intermedia]|uniref:CRISPR-associated endonuclease Cas9 n=1 Tax=Aquimarina intermedia TaxID=350814 RepID=A0A5S5CC95_9FLAO|nr:type II CRISPR RNA-guided endonuclease Cas9 [Aquimarina intermedia]TYP75956.1 CRISPR-associated endonuclease Csn1 [Aquimarina intermedia]
MRRILGLDLGTTSIGWAFVQEAENNQEESKIIQTGVRVVPLNTDEQTSFEKGQSITINADRTLKRGARRNLHRYKMRREAVINLFKKINFINDSSTFSEEGKQTHSTYALRAKATGEKLEKEDLTRVFLMLNKKRGYKSSRKANNQEEGQLIDGMAIAKRLHKEHLTPGELSYKLLLEGKKNIPDYYRSDLQTEFDKIWQLQKTFHPEIFTDDHYEAIETLNKTKTGQYFEKSIGTPRAECKGKRNEKKLQFYRWRNDAVHKELELSKIAFVLTEIKGEINSSSGYLGAISDRSKELYFNDETVGQNLYKQLQKDPNASLKNQVFYRQDYMDEFDAIWQEQSKHYKELTEQVRKELRDITIFYQRRLKSQKGLINICELESRELEILENGIKKRKLIGPKVAPKSSPVFQQAKVWQSINNIVLTNEITKEIKYLDDELRQLLFEELNWLFYFSKAQLLNFLKKHSDIKGKNWKVNLEKIEGNKTNATLLAIYNQILQIEGYEALDSKISISQNMEQLKYCFETIGINSKILSIDYSLKGDEFVQQPSYKLWHLLYSYEDDSSSTGIESLIKRLQEHFNFKEEHANLLCGVAFTQDYGSLSVRALRKLMPYLEEGKIYNEASELAGYKHSNYMTAEENKDRQLLDKLEVLKKNSLRNPVVEKILNQMINVINAIIENPELGKPDEIRIEMARELKKTAKQRKEMTAAIVKATDQHKKYRERIQKEFGLSYVSRKDLIKYKLYLELKATGFKTLYSGTYVKPEELFTNKFDVEHIIPQSILFDDSFSNKTIELRSVNLEKGKETAFDFCERKGCLNDFKNRLEECYSDGKGELRYGKRSKLLMSFKNIPENFLNRDLGNTAYIARKAIQILQPLVRQKIVSTSGNITSKLRSDWELINVLQELNWKKYEVLGYTYYDYNKDGKALPRIKDWSKRNDHRHHAMDAIAVAFTRPAFIQYLNTMHAKSGKSGEVIGIEKKYTYRDAIGGRKFKKPYDTIREDAKEHMDKILISHKAKNKVVTSNKNKIKISGKNNYKTKIELTPRGQLHKETIYGQSLVYLVKEEKISASFDEEKIMTVTKAKYRDALLKRLNDNENDPKKAFTGKNSITRNPVFISINQNVPDKVKTQSLVPRFTIRKNITPDIKLDKVVDLGVKRILETRLKQYNGKPKVAFADLDNNPIWLNKEKGITIKNVTITGVSNAEPLHTAKDHNGKQIIDPSGKPIPIDYVSTGNNHHVAVYRDRNGNLQEEVVSFYEAVIRKNLEQSIIKKNHEKGWKFLFTLKQNEIFVFPSLDFEPSEVDLFDTNNKKIISENLFRVQKISSKNYVFNHHLETKAAGSDTFKNKKELSELTYKFYQSEKYLEGIIKVRLNHLGDIVHIGEY